MADRWGRFSWPGVLSPRSCQYTMSQGVSPGAAVFRMNPQPGVPYANGGTLTIFDGVAAPVVLRGCRVDRVIERRNADGIVWEVTVMDRRWKWRECGAINLFANQLDPNGKFLPWTVASPVEIATACLQAMGERRFKIDLPVGLTTADARGLKEFLPTGVNFPPTGVNPPIDWLVQKPMIVLEQLAEMFGRVVVWRWDTDEVWVVPKGGGGPLPPGSISSTCPGVEVPRVPDGVAVVGTATRFQPDLELTALGEEWDGRLVPVNELSYAPLLKGQKHTVDVSGDWKADFRYYVQVNDVLVSSDPSDLTMTDVALTLKTKLLASPLFAGYNIAVQAPAADVIRFEANKEGPTFDATAYTHYFAALPTPPLPTAPKFGAAVKLQGQAGRKSWARSFPPLFPGVRATDRLTLSQAREKARNSVWRIYGLSGRDVSKKGKILVPGAGRVDPYQLVLLAEQCEQIVPDPGDYQVRLRDGTGSPLIQNFYNGLSKSKPAAVFGSVTKRAATHLSYVMDKSRGVNTGPDEQVQVGFSVDPEYRCVRFGGPVYREGLARTIEEPDLRLRTAVLVRDSLTNSPMTYQAVRVLTGSAGRDLVFERHDDVQLNVVPSYNTKRQVTGVKLLEADPLIRGKYYLDALALRYQVKASLVNVYNGIVPVVLDGAISQVTWNVSGEPTTGTETTASLNHEHNTSAPPFAARRRDELLRAAVKPGDFLGKVGDRARADQIVPLNRRPL